MDVLSSTSVVKYFDSIQERDIICAAFNSNLFYWVYMAYSDCYHLVAREIDIFKFDIEKLSNNIKDKLVYLCTKLMESYIQNSKINVINYSAGVVQQQQFYPKYSKHIIDDIDDTLGEYYNFTQEELSFIKDYDIRFRLGENEEND